MYYAQYNQMTDFETEYVFCKDNRLVLIVEYLFAKASTAMAGAELLKLRPLMWSNSSFTLEQQTQIQSILSQALKVTNLTSYKKLSVKDFELKLHMHTLGTSDTYFTYCKKNIFSTYFK